LLIAAVAGHKGTAELLIAKGADVNAKAVTGETPLDSAIKSKNTETANLLRKHGGKTSEELKAEGK
jgi:ankyrin repeat protein